jgi:leucine-rich repeat protein SHOC2
LPDSIGNFPRLIELYLQGNTLTELPDGIGNLSNLTEIYLSDNPWTDLSNLQNIPNLQRAYCFGVPLSRRYWTHFSKWKSEWLLNEDNAESRHALIEQIGCEKIIDKLSFFVPDDWQQDNIALPSKFRLDLTGKKLAVLPLNIVKLNYLTELNLSCNQLTNLPEEIDQLSNLIEVHLSHNQLTNLPASIANLSNLTCLYLSENPWLDLSSLQNTPNLESVYCFGVELPRRYWIKLSDWQSKWLLDEENVEIRQRLIVQIGYERICNELNAITLDTWREYTLLKIDKIEKIYNDEDDEPIGTEPMVLLKMTCPSTEHIHILRVPPEMERAEAAIMWVNHGIHPDKFAVQT